METEEENLDEARLVQEMPDTGDIARENVAPIEEVFYE